MMHLVEQVLGLIMAVFGGALIGGGRAYGILIVCVAAFLIGLS